MPDNHLYYGDNLDVLRRYVNDESVDLVYLDPPFKSNQDSPGAPGLFAEPHGRWAAWIACFLIVCVGCSSAEPVPQDRTLSDRLKALKDEDASVRHAAAKALREMGPAAKSAVPELIKVLTGDPNESVRADAAASLGRIGPGAKAAVPALINALNSENADVRAAAAEALGFLGAEADSATPALTRIRARDSDDIVRQQAAVALTRIQTADKVTRGPLVYIVGVPALISLMVGCVWARRILTRLRVPSLVNDLKHWNPAKRRRAARALGSAGLTSKAVVPALIEALKDKDESVRTCAEQSLARCGLGSGSNVADLIMALRHDNPLERLRAAVALGVMGSEAESAVPALIKALKNKNTAVRCEAIEALGKIGPKARSAVGQLHAALKDTDYAIHHAASLALQRIET